MLVRFALEALPAVLAGVNQLGDGVHGGIEVFSALVLATVLGLGDGGLVVVLGLEGGFFLAVGSGHVAGEVEHGLEDGVAPAALDVAVLVEEGLLPRSVAAAAASAVAVKLGYLERRRRGRRFLLLVLC